MSEDEGFLRRWSRRKQAAAARAPEAGSPPMPAETEAAAAPPADGAKPDPAVDLSTLPPVESIDAGTDIRGFLQKGVPQDLTRAALRRAWSEDPAIRNFIEVAENQWDFATGSDIPGFGTLEPGADIGRMVADAIGDIGRREPARAEPTPEVTADERAGATSVRKIAPPPNSPMSDPSGEHAGDDAPQQSSKSDIPSEQRVARRHGTALPQ